MKAQFKIQSGPITLTSSQGSDESAHPGSLAGVFAACIHKVGM